MSWDTILSIAAILIPASVTIIGLRMNSNSIKKSFQNEIEKQKKQINLEKIAELPKDVLNFYAVIMRRDEEEITREMQKLYDKILAYGYTDAINIVASLQSRIYHNNKIGEQSNEEGIKSLTYLILLFVQVKKDLTGVSVNPEKLYQIKINDYDDNVERIRQYSNDVVEELELDRIFLI